MRRLLAILAVAAVLGALASLAPLRPAPAACAGSGSHHAALVVEHGDGSVVRRCVAFDGDSINGEQLLNDSGVAWSGQSFGGFGEAVCALDGEPARYTECPGADRYWAVFAARSTGSGTGEWQLTSVGISGLTLHDGDAEGLRYGPTSGTPAAPASPAGACAAAAPVFETASPSPETGTHSGPDLGLLAAVVGAAALAGLGIVRLLLRRTRR